jgi:hypothetical protein
LCKNFYYIGGGYKKMVIVRRMAIYHPLRKMILNMNSEALENGEWGVSR